MTSETLFIIRSALLGGTGAVCLLYAALSLITGQPDPLPVWITALVGLTAAVIIWSASIFAGRAVAAQSFDEGYQADARRARGLGFWVAIWLYPLFGLLLWRGLLSGPVAFASMGCLTVASYLLSLVWFDMKGRDGC